MAESLRETFLFEERISHFCADFIARYWQNLDEFFLSMERQNPDVSGASTRLGSGDLL